MSQTSRGDAKRFIDELFEALDLEEIILREHYIDKLVTLLDKTWYAGVEDGILESRMASILKISDKGGQE